MSEEGIQAGARAAVSGTVLSIEGHRRGCVICDTDFLKPCEFAVRLFDRGVALSLGLGSRSASDPAEPEKAMSRLKEALAREGEIVEGQEDCAQTETTTTWESYKEQIRKALDALRLVRPLVATCAESVITHDSVYRPMLAQIDEALGGAPDAPRWPDEVLCRHGVAGCRKPECRAWTPVHLSTVRGRDDSLDVPGPTKEARPEPPPASEVIPRLKADIARSLGRHPVPAPEARVSPSPRVRTDHYGEDVEPE